MGAVTDATDATVANDYQEIGSSNNRFNIQLPSSSGFYTYSFTLTSGSPNILGLVTDLNSMFAATTLTYWNGTVNANLTIVVSFSTQFNYLIFTLNTTVSTVKFDFTMANDAGQILGFSPLLYTYSSVGIINSDFCPDVSRYSEIYIYSSCVENNYIMNSAGQGLNSVQILFSIPITSTTGSNIIYQNFQDAFKQKIMNNLDRLEISIRDRNGDIIELNNSSTFCFKLEKVKGKQAIMYQQTARVQSLIY